MKLPKFMKTRARDEKQSTGRQMLITELQFQPHKNAAAIMNFDKSLYMTPKGLATMTPKLATDNSRQPAPNGRYVKSAQPKRLQRTPKCYVGANKIVATTQTTPISTYVNSNKTVQTATGLNNPTLNTPIVFKPIVSQFLLFFFKHLL